MIIAVDPGKTVGYATWSNEGIYRNRDEVPIRDFYDFLTVVVETLNEHTFVMEDFRLNPDIPQGGSKMEACQVIGAVTFAAGLCEDATLVLQPPSILFIAQKWSGIRVPPHGSKNHDANSAYNHGIHYLVTQKIIKNPAHSRIVRTSGN